MPTIISGTTGVDQITGGTIQTADFAAGVGPVLTKYYESPELTISNAGMVTATHGLGGIPKLSEYFAICKVAENGYAIGDFIQLGHTDYFATGAGAAIGFTPTLSSTTIDIRYANNANPIIELNKATGATASFTNANWRLIVRAWA